MFAPFDNYLEIIAKDSLLCNWLTRLPLDLQNFLKSSEGQEFRRYEKILERTRSLTSDTLDLNTEYVSCGDTGAITERQHTMLQALYREMMPWRKGPYCLFGEKIESEWRSFMKWDRLIKGISPLKDRRILDVGCGNGYHMWRMLGEGASLVTGIDPCALFTAQFELFKRCTPKEIQNRIHLLPLGIEQLPALEAFDMVFSMGVLYHRRSAVDHLIQLQNQLVPGGELVLETLVIEGDESTVLIPKDRYAKMPNIWFIPSIKTLENLLNKCGFINVKLIDVCMTTIEEQRRTELMTTESLEDFLDPHDHTRTVEGYQAPTRAVFTAQKKGR